MSIVVEPGATRKEVFDALESERRYQAKKWGEHPHEIAAFVCYIMEHAHQLQHVVSTTSEAGNANAILDHVRKVGALAVACMEQHGAPRREGF